MRKILYGNEGMIDMKGRGIEKKWRGGVVFSIEGVKREEEGREAVEREGV
jgi:hypothetical protein